MLELHDLTCARIVAVVPREQAASAEQEHTVQQK
jgi:hypothetical protein